MTVWYDFFSRGVSNGGLGLMSCGGDAVEGGHCFLKSFPVTFSDRPVYKKNTVIGPQSVAGSPHGAGTGNPSTWPDFFCLSAPGGGEEHGKPRTLILAVQALGRSWIWTGAGQPTTSKAVLVGCWIQAMLWV